MRVEVKFRIVVNSGGRVTGSERGIYENSFVFLKATIAKY